MVSVFVQYCVVLCSVCISFIVFHSTVLYCIPSYCVVVKCIFCVVLYRIVLNCIVLY